MFILEGNMFVIRSIIAFCLCSFFLHSAIGKTLITISKKKGGQVVTRVSLKEVQSAYGHVKKLGAESTPTPKQFVNDYVRYIIGVEEAYKDTTLVKNAKIKSMFASPLLKQGFEQLLYKMLAETKLQKQIAQLDKKARTLSKTVLLKFYRQNPEYDFHFIQISFPEKPNKKQLAEATDRASQIYKEVRKSKKPFPALVDIYSDNRMGKITVPRTRNTTYPSVYQVVSKMKNRAISTPVRAVDGLYIIKLNQRIPFGEANRTQIKAAYFDKERTKIFNNYFKKIQKQYTVQINQVLLKQIK